MYYHVCVFLFKGSKHVYISLEAASIVVTLHSNTPSAILVHPMNMATSKGGSFTLTNIASPSRFPSEEKKQKNITRSTIDHQAPQQTYLQLPIPNSHPFFWVPPPKNLVSFSPQKCGVFLGDVHLGGFSPSLNDLLQLHRTTVAALDGREVEKFTKGYPLKAIVGLQRAGGQMGRSLTEKLTAKRSENQKIIWTKPVFFSCMCLFSEGVEKLFFQFRANIPIVAPRFSIQRDP